MVKLRRNIIIARLIVLAMTITYIALFYTVIYKNIVFSAGSIFIMTVIPFIAILWLTARCHCRTYKYKNSIILIYAGIRRHYIKINGEILDEFNCMFFYTPINLSCTFEDNDMLSSVITIVNFITVAKINGKRITPCKLTAEEVKKVNSWGKNN